MTRLDRALLYTRTLSAIRRAAVPTMEDMVEVQVRVKAPVSRELWRYLQCDYHSKGPNKRLDNGRWLLSYPVKTCYPEHLPGFAREIVAAMRVARMEGRRLQIVRYPCEH